MASAVLYKYNMVLREVVRITGPEVLDAWDYFPKRRILLLLEINHVVFVLLCLINILTSKILIVDSFLKIFFRQATVSYMYFHHLHHVHVVVSAELACFVSSKIPDSVRPVRKLV